MLQNDVKNGAAKQQPLGRAQGTWRLRSGPTLAPEAWPRDWGPEVCTLPSFTTGHPVLLSPLLQITKKRPQRGINIRGQEDTARNEAALSRVLSSPFPSGPGLGRTTLAPRNQQCERTQNPELGRAPGSVPRRGSGHRRPELAIRASTAWALVSANCGEKDHCPV